MSRVRVCILSDTHGRVDARILGIAADCDWCLHAGDIGGQLVLDALRAANPRTLAVRGNNDIPDKWAAEEKAVLRTLPRTATLELPGGVLAAEHGHRVSPVSQRHARLRDRHAGARAVVYGHSHRLSIDQTAEPWILNPGAAGRSRTYGGPSCLVLTASRAKWAVEACRFSPD